MPKKANPPIIPEGKTPFRLMLAGSSQGRILELDAVADSEDPWPEVLQALSAQVDQGNPAFAGIDYLILKLSPVAVFNDPVSAPE